MRGVDRLMRRAARATPFLVGLLLVGCGSGDGSKTVSLPTFSFVGPRALPWADGDAAVERRVGRSVWAVVPARGPDSAEERVLGSAVAVSGDALLASCDLGPSGDALGVLRRSSYRAVTIRPADPSGSLCELRPQDVWLRTVAGYRPFDGIRIGEPVFAVASESSRTFRLFPGTIEGKGSSDDPFLETTLALPAGTRSAAVFDGDGSLIGFASSGPTSDAIALAVPVTPVAARWLAEAGRATAAEASQEETER